MPVIPNLEIWMEANRYTNDDVAGLIGVTPQSIWNYRNCERLPRKDIRKKFKEVSDGFITSDDWDYPSAGAAG